MYNANKSHSALAHWQSNTSRDLKAAGGQKSDFASVHCKGLPVLGDIGIVITTPGLRPAGSPFFDFIESDNRCAPQTMVPHGVA
jgi:hypothetical protein